MALILIVEDSEAIAELVADHLHDQGHEVTCLSDGVSALACLVDSHFDLVVLDLMLPGISGIEVCRRLRAKGGRQPVVVMLTARREEQDVLDGYDAGADDYVRKPFSVKELVRRLDALLALRARRAPAPDGDASAQATVLSAGRLEVDLSARRARAGASELDLAPMEFDLLVRLLRSAGQVLDRETLLHDVWGYEHFGYARTVDSHVTRLRRKLARAGHHDVIRTVHGIGYCLECEA